MGALSPAPAGAVPPRGGEPAPGVGQAALGGFARVLGQTLVLKVASVLGRIALARWLTPADFGLVGLAETVAVLPLLVQRNGLREVLLRQGPRIGEWTSAGVSFSVATSLLGGLLGLALVPLAVAFYGEPRLLPLLLFLAVTSPVMSLDLVPLALLESRLRFRAIARVNTACGLAATALAVGGALLGWGAFAVLLPRPVVALGSALALWRLARPRLRWAPDWPRWREIARGGGLLLSAAFLGLAVSHGDYALVGLAQGTGAAGFYYFAFGLAMQTWTLLAPGLGSVLLPSFGRLTGLPAARQREAFVRAAGLLCLVGVPACLVQAAVAGPLVRVLFGQRWEPAVPVLQWLSLGVPGALLTTACSRSLLSAQGRWGTQLRLQAASAVVFLAVVFLAARQGSLPAVAATVASCLLLDGVVRAWVALRPLGGGLRDVAGVLAAPAGAAVVAVGLAVALLRLATGSVPADLFWLLSVPALAGGLYAAILLVVSPSRWRDLVSLASRLPAG